MNHVSTAACLDAADTVPRDGGILPTSPHALIKNIAALWASMLRTGCDEIHGWVRGSTDDIANDHRPRDIYPIPSIAKDLGSGDIDFAHDGMAVDRDVRIDLNVSLSALFCLAGHALLDAIGKVTRVQGVVQQRLP